MSREILFRGRRTDNGEWVEGNLIYAPDNDEHFKYIIIPQNDNGMYTKMLDLGLEKWHKVDPSTVCQYTGLEDENGKKIFEGDILEGRWDDKHPEDVTRAVVEWILFGWYIHEIGKSLPDEMDESDIDIWTVCGNVWDNPNLLEGGTGEDD